MRFICISIDIIQKIQTWTCQIIYSRCQNQFFYFHKRKSPFFKYFHCRILQPDPGILSILSTKISPTWAFINDCNSPVESFSFDFLFSHDTNLRKYVCSISIKLRFCIKAVFYTHLINLNRGFIGFKKKKSLVNQPGLSHSQIILGLNVGRQNILTIAVHLVSISLG